MVLEKPWPLPDNPSVLWRFASRLTLYTVSRVGIFIIKRFNDVQVHNAEQFHKFIQPPRQIGRNVVTAGNHSSYMDDPFLLSALAGKFKLKDADNYRWAMAAEEIIFLNKFLVAFFSFGQTIPVKRGDGIYQKCIDFIIEKMNSTNDMWLNIFPQGRIQMPPEDWIRLKWGIGRILSEAQNTPLVLPYWHEGMNKILSVNELRSALLPKFGQKVTVVFGDAIDFTEQVRDMRKTLLSPREQRLILTNRVEAELRHLKQKCLELHNSRLMPFIKPPASSSPSDTNAASNSSAKADNISDSTPPPSHSDSAAQTVKQDAEWAQKDKKKES